MTPSHLQIGYLPCVVVVGCVALVLGLLVTRLQMGAQVARAAAGGAIVALVSADLIPDALSDAREEGVTRWLVVLLVCVTFVVVRAWRSGHRHRRSDATPALLSVHGLVEGVAAGAGTGINVVLGLPALLGMAIHKSVEGVDLALYLRSAESTTGGALALVHQGKRRIGWLALNAVAPLAGVGAGHSLALPQLPTALTLSVLCGLLLQVAFPTGQCQAEPLAARTRWRVFGSALAMTLLLAALAATLSS